MNKELRPQPTLPDQESPNVYKIFIVEDHPVFRQGLIQLISREPGLSVCGHAGDFEGALKAVPRLQPDLALIDISLPGKSGLDLVKQLRASNPKLKMLAVSMHDEALYANRVLRLGGDGYIMKQEDPREILNAIRDVLAGHIYVSEAVLAGQKKSSAQAPSTEPGRALDRLTDAQLEVLEMLGQGKSNEEIAAGLHLALEKVDAECADMRKKLKLRSDNALIRFAVCWVETGSG